MSSRSKERFAKHNSISWPCRTRNHLDKIDRVDHHFERVSFSTAELREFSPRAIRSVVTHTLNPIFRNSPLPSAGNIAIQGNCRRLSGQPIVHLSCPFGMRQFFSERLMQDCTSYGFKTVFNTSSRLLCERQRLDLINRAPWNSGEDLETNVRYHRSAEVGNDLRPTHAARPS